MSDEQNLSRRERRAQAKGAGGDETNVDDIKDRNQRLRSEAAAKRRKSRESERREAAGEGLDAGERVDDALIRTADATGRFVRGNFAWLQWIIIGGVVAAIAILIVGYRRTLGHEKQGAALAGAFGAQFGKIVTAEPDTPSDARLVDPRLEFKDAQERTDKALKTWKLLAQNESPALALAGKLGVAGNLYDQSKYGEARAAYEAVLSDGRVALHPAERGRALEGVGFTWEAEKKLPEALKAYEKLSSVDKPEFKKLRTFHVARIEYLSGNKERALSMLSKLDAELSKDAGPQGPTDYIGAAVRDLLKTVDPTRAAAEQLAASAEQTRLLMKQFEEMQKKSSQGAPQMPELPVPMAPIPDLPAAQDLPIAPPAPPAPPAPSTVKPTAPAPRAATPAKSPAAPEVPAPAAVVPPAPVQTPPSAPTPVAP